MSSSDADQYAEIILTLDIIRVNDYNALAALVLVVYECVISFDREVENIWRRKFTGASVLFVVNRYLAVLCIALVVAMNSLTVQQTCAAHLFENYIGTDNHHRCSVANRIYEATYLALTIIFALFSSLRIYALWNRNILLALIIFVLNLVPLGTNLSLFPVLTPVVVPAPYSECIAADSRPVSLDLAMIRLTRVCVIAADLLVVILIWIKTFKLSRQARDLNIKTSLTTLFLRDGSIYFVVLLIVNIAHMIVYEIAGASYISIFIPAITSVLISRFLLNLRQANNAQAGGGSKHFSEFSAPVFNLSVVQTIVGNMGESLDHPFGFEPEVNAEIGDVPESENPIVSDPTVAQGSG